MRSPKIRWWKGWSLLEAYKGESVSCHLQLLKNSIHFLAHGPFLHLQNTSLQPLLLWSHLLLLHRTLLPSCCIAMTFGLPDISSLIFHLQTLIFKSHQQSPFRVKELIYSFWELGNRYHWGPLFCLPQSRWVGCVSDWGIHRTSKTFYLFFLFVFLVNKN